ncbi:hypothetical protein TorRG33x02_242720 [Trema orientale]|uniref:Uncharacterized protein n=1 Tax=Trema orientale TaxID=63057 RepID=A0A2P5DST0_TREOI|nr:hypothetical protein TorRG33x02_242720 [Trema orientale]
MREKGLNLDRLQELKLLKLFLGQRERVKLLLSLLSSEEINWEWGLVLGVGNGGQILKWCE